MVKSMTMIQNSHASNDQAALRSRPRLRPVLISVRATAAGHWLVASRDGRRGGTFKTRDAALHYARDEAIALLRAVVVIFEPAGLATSETYEGHARVRVSSIPLTSTKAA
jgi:hypothetical protein